MVRIERLNNGVLQVIGEDSTEYIRSAEELHEPVKRRYLILSAADAPAYIEEVGRRVSDTVFLVSEDGDPPDDNGIELRLLTKSLNEMHRNITHVDIKTS